MKAVLVLAILLSIYLAVKIVAEIKDYNNLPAGAAIGNTISFEGSGKVSAQPDLAVINFTLRESAKELKNAQDKVAQKESAVLAFLADQKIDKKDIKTENYSSYPKYDSGTLYCGGATDGTVEILPCRRGNPNVIGYEVSENVSVKVRELSKAGEAVKGIGVLGVTEMNGPNFSIEKEDSLKEQARQMAIAEAKAKAKSLSEDLGVHLARIVNFSENGNSPIFAYDRKVMMESAGSAPAPALPAGEKEITSNVTITYEIR